MRFCLSGGAYANDGIPSPIRVRGRGAGILYVETLALSGDCVANGYVMQELRRVHQLEQTPICDLDWEQTPICVLNWLTNERDVCVLNLHSHFGFVFSILQ